MVFAIARRGAAGDAFGGQHAPERRLHRRAPAGDDAPKIPRQLEERMSLSGVA
jgi:hypothetical protein